MNADALRAALNTVIAECCSSEEARCDMQACVRTLDPRFGELFADLLAETALDTEVQTLRGAGLLLQVAAIQLADDLADGDCTYLQDPRRHGPGAQALLQAAAHAAWVRSLVTPGTLLAALEDLCAVGSAQQRELRTQVWSLETYLWLAREINGRQHAAYLAIVFDGGAREIDARAVGHALGTCVHVVGDAVSHDARWRSLSSHDRIAAAAAGVEALEVARGAKLRSLARHLDWMSGFLNAAARRPDSPAP